jgi:hypothetical protein
MLRLHPDWFSLSERLTPEVNARIAEAAKASADTLPLQVKFLPLQAHWFTLDSLLLANRVNREGMHANAISLTRQCVERFPFWRSRYHAMHPLVKY